MRGCRFKRDLFFLGDELEMIGNQFRRDSVEIEPLATAYNRGQHFLRLGRCENKFHVRRRFLQRFEKRIKRRRRQHMHFVDDINFVARLRWRVTDVFAELTHLFDSVIAGSIDLENVEAVTGRNLAAIIAGAVRINRRPFYTVERFGQNSRRRRFPNPARSDEQISVRQPVLGDRILERARDVSLPDQIVKRLGAVFAGENFVAHGSNLIRRSANPKQKTKKTEQD